jgi:ethanolamine utilization protein EutN
MRIARVTGRLTINRRVGNLRPGKYVIAEALDAPALRRLPRVTHRDVPMPESLVVFDELGAAQGQLIAVSEDGEATMPFYPDSVPIDAYCAAILDQVSCDPDSAPAQQGN